MTTLSHFFDSLLSKFKGYDSELDNHLFGISHSAKLYRGTKLKVKVVMYLIYKAYKGIIDLKVITFTQNSAIDV